MPLRKSRSPDEAGGYRGSWRIDPLNQFDERFYKDHDYTPHVRLKGQMIWDLAFARRVPDEHERQSGDLMLIGSCSWVRLSATVIQVGCGRNTVDVMSAAIPLRSLHTFAIHGLGRRDMVTLEVTARAFSESPADGLSHGQAGVLRMSMLFEPEHESPLQDLRRFLEHECGHDMAGPARPTMSPPGATPARKPIPPSAVRKERVDYWEPDTNPEPATALAGEPEHEREASRDGHRETAGGARPGDLIRPAARVLAVCAEVAPKTKEWLSYAAPTTQLLLAPSDGGGDDAVGSGPCDVHAQGDEGG